MFPPVDCFASEPQYAEHLAPVWAALPAELRGILYATKAARTALGGAVGSVQASKPPRGTRPVLVASYSDLRVCGRRPVVLLEHGAGQTYGNRHAAYSDGAGRERVVLFLAPNDTVGDRCHSGYPAAAVAVLGDTPKMDRWRPRPSATDLRPVVALVWHWDCRVAPESRTALWHYADGLAGFGRQADAAGWEVLGHAHPKIRRAAERVYTDAGIRVATLDEVYARAWVLVCDNSSVGWEFASLDRPVVWVNAPWYRRDVTHGLRFWTYADSGPQVDDPGRLFPAVQAVLENPDRWVRNRRRAVDAVYPCRDGGSAHRAAEAICEVFDGWQPPERSLVPNPYAARPRRSRERSLVGVVGPVSPSPDDTDQPNVQTEVPEHVLDVLAFMRGSPQRAALAWAAERQRDRVRKTIRDKARSLGVNVDG